MVKALGRKQNIKNEDWLEAVKGIEDRVSKKNLDARVKKTVSEIKKKTKGKKSAYAWSGGKDSLVLGKLCEEAGITSCVLVVSDLEYPQFIEWVKVHQPPELEIINTGQDLKWDRRNITKITASI